MSLDVTLGYPKMVCSLQTRDDQETRAQWSNELEPSPSELLKAVTTLLPSLGYLLHR